MEQNKNRRMTIGLNIHILSFYLKNAFLKENDDVRVSFTTFPEKIKQHFCVKARKMNLTNHVFSLNITNETKGILIVFRRKNLFLNDPIIGCFTIKTMDLPTIPQDIDAMSSFSVSSDVKKLKIYEPVIRKEGEKPPISKPQVVGQINIQYTITKPYVFKEKYHKNNNKSSKNNNMKDKSCNKKNISNEKIGKMSNTNEKLSKKTKVNNNYILID